MSVQPEVGRRYVLRNGEITTKLTINPNPSDRSCVFLDTLTGNSWSVDGEWHPQGIKSPLDIVSEYIGQPTEKLPIRMIGDYDHLGDLQREYNEMQKKLAMQDELFTAVVKVGDRFHLVDGREAVAVQAPTSEPAIRTFASGATRNLDHNKLDYEGFNCPAAQRAFAEYMHTHRKQADGTMRDGDNWQKGIPIDQYAKSLIRHVHDLHLLHDGWSLQRPEDGIDLLPTTENKIELLCAIWFNVQGMIHELLKEERNADQGT